MVFRQLFDSVSSTYTYIVAEKNEAALPFGAQAREAGLLQSRVVVVVAIIDANDAVAPGEEGPGQVEAYEPGRAGDENLHEAAALLPERSVRSNTSAPAPLRPRSVGKGLNTDWPSEEMP